MTQNSNYYDKFFKLANVYFILEEQENLFSYYSFIPTIIEILLLGIKWNKKENAINFWKELDDILITENDLEKKIVYRKNIPNEEELWLIARCFFNIYDIRNSFLHQWKTLKEKTIITFKWLKIKLYDVFQLIVKYKVLNSLIENKIIDNIFFKFDFDWNIYTTWKINVSVKKDLLKLDDELKNLLIKAESDKELKTWLYSE